MYGKKDKMKLEPEYVFLINNQNSATVKLQLALNIFIKSDK